MLTRLSPAAALAIVLLLPSACTRVHSTKGTPEAKALAATGEAATKAGKHADAAAAYRKAVEADPDFVDAHQRFIETTRRAEEPNSRTPATPQLQSLYEGWVKAEPNRASYRWALGFLSSDPDKADGYFNEALKIDPSFERAHVLLAKNADLRGDWASQQQHLKAAVEADPGSAQYLMRYAQAMKRTDRQRFRELASDVVSKFPDAPEAAQALYELATASRDAERRAYFERIRANYPADRFNYGATAMSIWYAELTVPSEALGLARDMAKWLPANKTWATRLAQQEAMARATALIGEGKSADALATIEKTSRPSGLHGATWVLLKAEAAAGAGETRQAYDAVLDALTRAPEERLQTAVERYGAALKKTAPDIEADVWRARDAKAVEAPAFELPGSTDGKPVRLADYRGGVVLLAFWFPG